MFIIKINIYYYLNYDGISEYMDDELAIAQYNERIDEQIETMCSSIEFLVSIKKYYCPSRLRLVNQMEKVECTKCNATLVEEQAMYCDSGHHVCHECLFYCGMYFPMETCQDDRCKRRLCIKCRAVSKNCTRHQ